MSLASHNEASGDLDKYVLFATPIYGIKFMYQIKQMKQFYVIYSNLSILELEGDRVTKLKLVLLYNFFKLKVIRLNEALLSLEQIDLQRN